MNLFAHAYRKQADALAARLPHLSARRERGAKERAFRELRELRRQEIEAENAAKKRRAA